MKNTILTLILVSPLSLFAADQKTQHKHVDVKSGSLTEKQWKGSCETLGKEGGSKKCDWSFTEDKTGKHQCTFFGDEYCVGEQHYKTDENFKYEAGKKKDTWLLSYNDGVIEKRLIKFINDKGMLSETVLEETARKATKPTKVKSKTTTYTGY